MAHILLLLVVVMMMMMMTTMTMVIVIMTNTFGQGTVICVVENHMACIVTTAFIASSR